MAQNYNIYINEKALIITLALPEGASNYQLVDIQDFDFQNFYKVLPNNPQSVFYLICQYPKSVFKMIKESVRIIEAAGGLVQSDEGKYLFIKRNGRWDLPKGKLEEGERKRDAAVREVEEECGITVKRLGNKLIKTYHVYEIKGKAVLKISHWYAMTSKSKQKLIPQIEEGITEVKWIDKKNWSVVRANTFPSILDVLNVVEV